MINGFFFMGWGLGGKGNHQNITEPEGGITTKILPFPKPPSDLILIQVPDAHSFQTAVVP